MTGFTVATRAAGRHEPGTGVPLFVVLAAQNGPRRDLVRTAMEARGIRVATVDCLPELCRTVELQQPDAAVVDVGLAGDRLADALSLARSTGTALVALAVRDAAVRTQLLLAGADDCLPGSYAPEELTARVIAVVRRVCGAPPTGAREPLQAGPLLVDVRSRRVEVHGCEVFLTAREFDLLSYLVRHRGEVLSRDRLLAEVWGYTFGSADTVTVHMRRLRSKVETDPGRPEFIRTVWGVGYRFESG